jgi:hypothetical protein
MLNRSMSRFHPSYARSFSASASRNSLSSASLVKAERISNEWKGTNLTGGLTKNFIGGEFVKSQTDEWHDVVDPVLFSPFHTVSSVDTPDSTALGDTNLAFTRSTNDNS